MCTGRLMLNIGFNPELFKIFGPLSVHIYGIFIALGVVAFITLTLNHPVRKKYISGLLYERLLVFTILSALAGARIVHIISEWHSYHSMAEAFSLWNGGLSVLGGLLGGLIFIPIYLSFKAVPVLPILDLAASYLPLTQAIARLGCLFAGCCFGCQTAVAWGITYSHAGSHAPLNAILHPTQLYSSLIFLAIFIFLQVLSRTVKLAPGQITALYLILSSLERFMVDFFRGDRIINTAESLISTSYFSLHQWLSIGVMGIGIVLFIFTQRPTRAS